VKRAAVLAAAWFSGIVLSAQRPPIADAVRPFVSVDAPVIALVNARVIDGSGSPAR